MNLIQRGGRSIKVEPRTMDVLEHLAAHAGEVVSVAELLAAVWRGVVVGDGSVYLAITQLRQALATPGDDTVYIETIPKRGYRLTVPVEHVELDASPADAVSAEGQAANGDGGAAAGGRGPAGADPAAESEREAPVSTPGHPRPAAPVAEARSRWPWLVAAGAVLALGISLVPAARYFGRAPTAPSQQLRFRIRAPGYVAGIAGLAISPDGAQIAYTASSDGVRQIWLRPLSALTARPLPGTENAVSLFWSRDGRELAFHADDKLKKIDVATGRVLTLADTLPNPPGFWSRDGTILYSTRLDGSVAVARVPAAGGTAKQVTTPADPEYTHIRPRLLADDDHFLYVGLKSMGPAASVYVGSLAEPDRAPLVVGHWDEADLLDLTYVDGYLLHTRGTRLVAEPFDGDALAVGGEAKVVADEVGDFAVSRTGVLVYREMSDAQAAEAEPRRLAWYDRSGRRLGEVDAPTGYRLPHLSPDGRFVAVTAPLPGTSGAEDVWVVDAQRGGAVRVTFNDAYEGAAVWSPDGAEIAYNSSRGGGVTGQIYRRAASGTGAEVLLFTGADDEFAVPEDWSRDGRYLLFTRTRLANILSRTDIWVAPLAGDEPAFPLIESPFRKGYPQLSPDGRWLAYGTNESGDPPQIVVQPFPNVTDGKWYMSTHGGREAKWREDGREIFYLTEEGVLTAVDVEVVDGVFHAGAPHALFAVNVDLARDRAMPNYHYDVADNGERFLFNELTEGLASREPDRSDADPPSLNVIVNWTAGLD